MELPKLGPSLPSSNQPQKDGNESQTNGSSLLSRLTRWLDRNPLPDAQQLRPLYLASSKDEAANMLAREWANRYRSADEAQRLPLLTALAQAGASIENANTGTAAASGNGATGANTGAGANTAHFNEAAARLFRRLYAQSDSLELMVQLRADMLRWQKQEAGLTRLEQGLGTLLSNWFDVGMLEMRHINWDSPASLLEKLIHYEAVHEIRSWEDMRRRVATDRRCYAFFHPRMREVPLIFVEVAFAENMVADVHTLLDPAQPVDTLNKARWAIFYSISNTQAGLRGISFGNFLLKRVIEELKKELPKLKSFATLSPIPGFAKWLDKQSAEKMQAMLGPLAQQALKHATSRNTDPAADLPAQNAAGNAAGQASNETDDTGTAWRQRLQETPGHDAPEPLQRCGLRLAARYLMQMQEGQPLDPVARFHLGNGARIERLNWAADLSVKGRKQSCGMMVNYLYEPDQLDANRAQLEAGNPKVARAVQKL